MKKLSYDVKKLLNSIVIQFLIISSLGWKSIFLMVKKIKCSKFSIPFLLFWRIKYNLSILFYFTLAIRFTTCYLHIICRQRIIFGLGKTGMRIGVNSVLSDESSVVPNCYMNQTANVEINKTTLTYHLLQTYRWMDV